MALHYISRH